MTRWTRRFLLSVVIGAMALAVGCKRAPEDKGAVREAIVAHLSKNAALDVNQLNVDVTDVKFNGNEATAAVSIKPKSAPDQGMSMSYALERRGDKWQVKGRASGHGEGGAMPGSSETPAPVMPPSGMGGSSGASGAPSGDLPPGHPPVNAPPASKK